MRKHKNLWCDLAFRSDHASGGKVDPAWRAVFLVFPDRFLVGTDTFTPERWHQLANTRAGRASGWRVDGMLWHMAGAWELRFDVEVAGARHSLRQAVELR